jgi:2'-5' RNA ligase
MTEWPLHITLANVFAVDLDTSIKQKLSSLLASQPPISLLAGEDAVLGTTDVVLIERTDELQSLHDQIIGLLELNGAKFNTPEFTRAGFLPHSTIQKSGRLHKGDKVTINTISLVDMFPNQNWQQRRVLTNFKPIETNF